MKVKELLKKINMGGNAPIWLYNVETDKKTPIFYTELRGEDYRKAGDLKVNSMTVRDNILVIYAE